MKEKDIKNISLMGLLHSGCRRTSIFKSNDDILEDLCYSFKEYFKDKLTFKEMDKIKEFFLKNPDDLADLQFLDQRDDVARRVDAKAGDFGTVEDRVVVDEPDGPVERVDPQRGRQLPADGSCAVDQHPLLVDNPFDRRAKRPLGEEAAAREKDGPDNEVDDRDGARHALDPAQLGHVRQTQPKQDRQRQSLDDRPHRRVRDVANHDAVEAEAIQDRQRDERRYGNERELRRPRREAEPQAQLVARPEREEEEQEVEDGQKHALPPARKGDQTVGKRAKQIRLAAPERPLVGCRATGSKLAIWETWIPASPSLRRFEAPARRDDFIARKPAQINGGGAPSAPRPKRYPEAPSEPSR